MFALKIYGSHNSDFSTVITCSWTNNIYFSNFQHVWYISRFLIGLHVVHLFGFLCCVFGWFVVFVLLVQCCQCLWIVHYWMPLQFFLMFISSLRYIFLCYYMNLWQLWVLRFTYVRNNCLLNNIYFRPNAYAYKVPQELWRDWAIPGTEQKPIWRGI